MSNETKTKTNPDAEPSEGESACNYLAGLPTVPGTVVSLGISENSQTGQTAPSLALTCQTTPGEPFAVLFVFETKEVLDNVIMALADLREGCFGPFEEESGPVVAESEGL